MDWTPPQESCDTWEKGIGFHIGPGVVPIVPAAIIFDLGIGEMLQPYQKPHPPIGMSVIRGESMAATMAGQSKLLLPTVQP